MRRWKKRHNVSLRRGTSDGHKLPQNWFDLAWDFVRVVIKYRKANQYPLSNIWNMDQTMVRFDMPSKTTLEVKGSRNVKITTTGNEKRGFTVALGAFSDGTKMRAWVIFKEKKGVLGKRNVWD